MVTQGAKLRVLVVDDSALYRKAVRTVLEGISTVEVVGIANNGRIALDKIKQLKPNMITLDLEMPELDGLGLLREISANNIDVTTIMISSLTDRGAKATNTALQLGALDFVLKPSEASMEENIRRLREELLPKIEATLALRHKKQPLRREGIAAKRSTLSAPSATPKRVAPTSSRKFYAKPEVIGLGISTGGPPALARMLPRLPKTLPCPILLVQHMPPMFTASLAKDLNRVSQLNVMEAVDGQIAHPGEVLIAPGGMQMKVVRHEGNLVVRVRDDDPEANCKPSVNYLFRSIAATCKAKAIGVVMTGMGDDGTIGCQLMKKQGAQIITQDEESCTVFGMPQRLVDEGIADIVLPLNEIADQIAACAMRRALV